MATALSIVDTRLSCLECGFQSHTLLDHIVEVHGMAVAEYAAKHPDAPTVSQTLQDRLDVDLKGRRRTPAPPITELTVDMCGITHRVDHAIRPEQCLVYPPGYAWPTKGSAKKRVQRAVLALKRGRPVFIHGDPGVGKDACVHAWAAQTRKPSFIYTFSPGTDVKRWFYSREIGSEGTSWSMGVLFRTLVEGVAGSDGVARPALVLFSDIDRATPDQLEEFRLVLDTMSKRIVGPTGQVHNIMEGTQFAFTANSCGFGDERGRMSSQQMDASILDRMGRFIEFTHLHWDDESAILRSKFPSLVAAAPQVFDELGNATKALRAAIGGKGDVTLYADLTHRGLCEILAECEDLVWMKDGEAPANLLKSGFKAWLDRLDTDNKLNAKRLIDASISGGYFVADEEEDED